MLSVDWRWHVRGGSSVLRRYLVAYAVGHNNRIKIAQVGLCGYNYNAVRVLLWRMKKEFKRVGRGYYELRDYKGCV